MARETAQHEREATMSDEQRIAVQMKCVACGVKTEVDPREVEDMPMCPACFSPMVAESAVWSDE